MILWNPWYPRMPPTLPECSRWVLQILSRWWKQSRQYLFSCKLPICRIDHEKTLYGPLPSCRKRRAFEFDNYIFTRFSLIFFQYWTLWDPNTQNLEPSKPPSLSGLAQNQRKYFKDFCPLNFRISC